MRFIKTVFTLNFLYIVLIAAQIAAIIFLCLYVPAVIPLAAAYAGTFLLSAITAAILLTRCGSSEAKCAWFLPIAALPVAGAVIYLIATSGRKKYGLLKVDTAQTYGIGACAKSTCGTCPAGYDKAVYFKDGKSMLKSVFSEMKKAKNSIYIEFFIVSGGEILNEFISAIAAARANGAKVKMLIDGVGSAFKLRKKDLKRIRQAGAEVKVFRRITPIPRSRLNFRDHRKIVAIDGKIAYTGGINLADEYAGISAPYGVWKDIGVAVYGEAAKIFEGMFLAMWNGFCRMEFAAGGEKLCLPYCDNPASVSFCEDAYVRFISAAKERIHILTPYFCVTEKLAGALGFAARRGVDVKIILPHIPDKPYAFELSKACAQSLVPCGVKFYEYTPGFMHAKALICDGAVFLGSYNMDFRSMRQNFECGVLFENDGICSEVEEDFLQCLALSQPLTEGKISPARRFSRLILKLFAPLI